MPWTRPALDEEMAPAALVRSLRINYDLLEGSVALRDRVTTVTAVWTFSVAPVFTVSPSFTTSIIIGASGSTRVTLGLSINQGAADDEAWALLSSDVAHGVTSIADTTVYGRALKVGGADGGLSLEGFTEVSVGARVVGTGTVGVTAKSSAAGGYVELRAAKKSGTTQAAAGANENLVVIGDLTTTWLILDADGDLHVPRHLAIGALGVSHPASVGLTIQQAAEDGLSWQLKSSEVAHGITTVADTDTYGFAAKLDAASGGLVLTGLGDTTFGWEARGIVTTADTAKSAGGTGAVTLDSRLKSGTTVTALGAEANVLAVRNNGSSLFLFDADGDFHALRHLNIGVLGTTHSAAVGLTLNQGAEDGDLVMLKSSDVAHGVTTLATTDTWLSAQKWDATLGGIRLRGFSESQVGVGLQSIYTTGITTKSAAALAPVILRADKASGTGTIAPAADENLVAIAAAATTLYLWDADGDLHLTRHLNVGALGGAHGAAVGVTVNQAAEDGDIWTAKSSDVAHGVTTLATTDAWVTMQKWDGLLGGLRLRGFSESQVGIGLQAIYTTGVTTKSSAALAPLVLRSDKASGTGTIAPAADENLVAITAAASTLFLWDADGDEHLTRHLNIGALGSAHGAVVGLTVNQAAEDGDIVTFKSSDIAHGVTTLATTDAWLTAQKWDGLLGGIRLRGFSESAVGIGLQAIYTTDTTTKSASAAAALTLRIDKASGTGITTPAADANLLAVASAATNVLLVDADGDLHLSRHLALGALGVAHGAAPGVTVAQGVETTPAVNLKASDVAHGITTALTDVTTDTYGSFRHRGATGIFELTGLGEATLALYLQGYATTEDTAARSVGSSGPVLLTGYIKSGTTVIGPSADANVLVVRAGDNTRFVLDADGDSHQDVGTAWTNFDDHDDPALLTALSATVARLDDPIRQRFGSWIDAERVTLSRLGLVSYNPDGHHFVNMSRLTMLLTGAVRQLAARCETLERRLLPCH